MDTVLVCGNCSAALEVAANQRTTVCPYCAHPSVVERPATRDRPNPRFAVAFARGAEVARDALKQWQRSRSLFAHGGIRAATIADMRGIYVPAYLYSAVARSQWAADIGEDYTETETYTETDSEGNTVTKTRTVTRTEYRPLAGEHVGYVTDVLVTASRGLPNHELERIEPFDLRELRRYAPALISGWTTEEPSMTVADCMRLAQDEAVAAEGRRLSAFMPGDSHRNLRHQTTLDRQVADLLLLPVWVLAVRWHPQKPALRVLVNGQTGTVTGDAPLSWVKVTIATLVVLAVVIAVLLKVMS